VAEALVTNICYFSVLQELHNDKGLILQSGLKQEVLQHLEVSRTCSTPLHLQSDSVMDCYVKTFEEYLRKVIPSHYRDWDTQLPIFFLAYMASLTTLQA
jgi:hypothetical protein